MSMKFGIHKTSLLSQFVRLIFTVYWKSSRTRYKKNKDDNDYLLLNKIHCVTYLYGFQ